MNKVFNKRTKIVGLQNRVFALIGRYYSGNKLSFYLHTFNFCSSEMVGIEKKDVAGRITVL